MSAEAIKSKIGAGTIHKEKDGIEIAKIMIGRRYTTNEKDSEIAKLFKRTWMITENSLANVLTKGKVNDHKGGYERFIRENK